MLASKLLDVTRHLLPCRVQKASVDKSGRLVLELYLPAPTPPAGPSAAESPGEVGSGSSKRWLVFEGGSLEVLEARPAPTAGGDGHEPPPAVQGAFRKEIVPSTLTELTTDAGGPRLRFLRGDDVPHVLVVEQTADPRCVLCSEIEGGLRILAVAGGLPRPTDGRDLRRGRMYEAPRNPEPARAVPPGETPKRLAPPVDPALARLRVALRAEGKRLKRLTDALARDLERHGDGARHEEAGELLKTVLGQLRRGMTEIEVSDWQGEPRTIALDATLDAKGNLAELFKRARRARAAEARTRPRLEEARARLAAIDEARAKAAAPAPTAAELTAAEALLSVPESGGSARRKAARASKRQPWRSFRCSGDVVVRVGRGAKDNDALNKSARGHDLWLHVRGAHGAHVIAPSRGGDIDPELLLDAAHLAAWFSSSRGEPRADVQHTRVKHLRKPPGAPAGLVHVTQESVLHLRVDDARVQRLLAAEVASD